MQHDYNILNGTGLAVRTDINNALVAIAENNSGATPPATTFMYEWFADSSVNILKQRNGANTAWHQRDPLEYDTFGYASIASAATVNIGAAAASVIHITGTTTITAFDAAIAGLERVLIFDGSLTLTHNATSLILPNGANIVTSAGNSAIFVSEGSGNWRCISFSGVVSTLKTQDFRLTLTSATPVTTSDVTAATTLYLTPYKGNSISLYNGASWDTLTSSQMSIAVPATASQMYDVFVYNNAGVATLELTAWTNDTTRATALTYQDGVLVKTGALTRRYVGSFRTTNVSGQTEDSKGNRYVWNYYNRVLRTMDRRETTVSWTYTLATWRQANANTANQLNFIIGVSEDEVKAMVTESGQNTNTGVNIVNAIGLDSTTAVASGCIYSQFTSAAANTYITNTSPFKALVSAGAHYLAWLEQSTAIGTTTWVGNSNFGMQGELLG